MIQLKQLKKIKKTKNIRLTWLRDIINQRRLLELLKKSITNQDQQFSKKSKMKSLIFTTQ